jgi:hypothetical protein
VVSFDHPQQTREQQRREHFLPADKFALCFQVGNATQIIFGIKLNPYENSFEFQKALIVGRKLDDKLRLGSGGGSTAHSMGDKQSQGQQANKAAAEQNGAEPTLEFRPNNNSVRPLLPHNHLVAVLPFVCLFKATGNGQPGAATNSNGSQTSRSKSPGGHIINKISNFARGRYRNSLSEKQSNSVAVDDKVRKVGCWPASQAIPHFHPLLAHWLSQPKNSLIYSALNSISSGKGKAYMREGEDRKFNLLASAED